jgi:hypothetical protein
MSIRRVVSSLDDLLNVAPNPILRICYDLCFFFYSITAYIQIIRHAYVYMILEKTLRKL